MLLLLFKWQLVLCWCLDFQAISTSSSTAKDPSLSRACWRIQRPSSESWKWLMCKIWRGLHCHGPLRNWSKLCFPHSYHLYLFHENLCNNSASHWKKMGKIKALPLSMACCLSQVIIPKKYYIVIQWEDVCGCYRPFYDIQSITPSKLFRRPRLPYQVVYYCSTIKYYITCSEFWVKALSVLQTLLISLSFLLVSLLRILFL